MAFMARTDGVCDVKSEFIGVSLGDTRLDERLVRVVELMAESPSASFPEQMGNDAELEALYRFLGNKRVTTDKLLAGHLRETCERFRDQPLVRVVHDTTRLRYEGEREGLGVLQRGTRGFLAHVALAVSADESREPYGVLGLRPYVRSDTVARRKLTEKERYRAEHARSREDRESSRWEKLARDVSATLPESVRAIHIMDQEADDFALLAELQKETIAFVVRGSSSRAVVHGKKGKKTVTLEEALDASTEAVFRTVHLSPRSEKQASTRRHSARDERTAELHIKWGEVVLPCPERAKSDQRELQVRAVFVFEPNPPKGEEPVEWMLLTSEPVDSFEDAVAIVDHYRARWMIEEYFKALKTGCAIEKRQLMSFEALVRALALSVPIAWQLLALRHWSRVSPSKPARAIYSANHLLLLAMLLEKRAYALPKKPTVRDVMLGIAKLGGHITNNGDPGWLVLGRGMVRFVDAQEVWRLAGKI